MRPIFHSYFFTQKLFGLVRIFHANFKRKAILTTSFSKTQTSKLFRSKNAIESYQRKTFIGGRVFLKKSWFIRSNLSSIVLGSLKHYIVWLGKVSRLNWISITWLALKKHFAFQLSSLELALIARFSKDHNGLPLEDKTSHNLLVKRSFVRSEPLELWKLINCPNCAQKGVENIFQFLTGLKDSFAEETTIIWKKKALLYASHMELI